MDKGAMILGPKFEEAVRAHREAIEWYNKCSDALARAKENYTMAFKATEEARAIRKEAHKKMCEAGALVYKLSQGGLIPKDTDERGFFDP